MSSLSWTSLRIYFRKKSSDDGSVEIKKWDKKKKHWEKCIDASFLVVLAVRHHENAFYT